MWFVTVAVGIVYVGYAIVLAFPGFTVFGAHLPAFDFPYVPKISPLLISPASYYGIAISLVAAASVTFRGAKANHRRLYVQYLIADFIDLCERSDSGN